MRSLLRWKPNALPRRASTSPTAHVIARSRDRHAFSYVPESGVVEHRWDAVDQLQELPAGVAALALDAVPLAVVGGSGRVGVEAGVDDPDPAGAERPRHLRWVLRICPGVAQHRAVADPLLLVLVEAPPPAGQLAFEHDPCGPHPPPVGDGQAPSTRVAPPQASEPVPEAV